MARRLAESHAPGEVGGVVAGKVVGVEKKRDATADGAAELGALFVIGGAGEEEGGACCAEAGRGDHDPAFIGR